MGWIDIDHDEVQSAVAGNSAALERILTATQEPVYNLALKFLWHPQDAQDATQEILIRIMTNLSGFRGESAFGTWAYRVAVDHLLRAKKSRIERREISFRSTAAAIGNLDPEPLDEDETGRIYDIKIACTNGILMALKRQYRIAFVLGAVLEMKSETAAQILEVSPETFRQRLSRSRKAMAEFLGARCGLVNAGAACRCSKRVRPGLQSGMIEPYLALAASMKRTGEFETIEKTLKKEISTLERTALLYRLNADYTSPEIMARRVRKLLSGNLFSTPRNEMSGHFEDYQ